MFAQERYENKFGIVGYQYRRNLQLQTIQSHPVYTSLVVDLIENENQFLTRFTSFPGVLPTDNVYGYTITEVENGLRGVRSWDAWRDNMRNIPNSTSGNIDELFANWC